MNAARSPLNTFILRFWQSTEETYPLWRGAVQHVQTGARSAFVTADALLHFLCQWIVLPSEAAALEQDRSTNGAPKR